MPFKNLPYTDNNVNNFYNTSFKADSGNVYKSTSDLKPQIAALKFLVNYYAVWDSNLLVFTLKHYFLGQFFRQNHKLLDSIENVLNFKYHIS